MKRVLITLLLGLMLPQWANSTEKPEIVVQSGHAGGVVSVAYSPNGRWAASGGDDKLIKLWDAQRGGELRTLKGHGRLIRDLAFSPDSKLVASASWDNTVKVWDVATGTVRFSVDINTQGMYANAVRFSPDGKYVAAGGQDQIIRLWSTGDGRLVKKLTFSSHSEYLQQVNHLDFSPDGTRIFASYSEGYIRVWNVRSGKIIKQLHKHRGMVWAIAASANGKWFASGGEDGKVLLWNAKTFRQVAQGTMSSEVLSLAFSPDGSQLLASAKDGRVSLWLRDGMHEEYSSVVENGGIWSVAFAPQGKSVLVASNKGVLIEKLLPSMQQSNKFTIQAVTTDNIDISSDGRLIASSGRGDGVISVWDSQRGSRQFTLPSEPWRLRFTHRGHRIYTTYSDGYLRLWGLDNQKLIDSVQVSHEKIISLDVSSDDKRVLCGSSDGKVSLWNRETGAVTHSRQSHKDGCMG